MPKITAPGGQYAALISAQPCDGGFQATVTHVLQVTPASPAALVCGFPPLETVVEHEPIPPAFAESRQKAEHLAAAHFEEWARTHPFRSQ